MEKEKQGIDEKVTSVSHVPDSPSFVHISNTRDDALMKANEDVTEALRRTIGLMQGELERSVLTTQMLGMTWFLPYVPG